MRGAYTAREGVPAFPVLAHLASSRPAVLTTDSALKNNEGLAPPDAAAVVTVSPAELWPPNRRFSDVHIGMSLPGAVQLNSAIAVSLTVNGITDDQVSEDDAGGPWCRLPTSKVRTGVQCRRQAAGSQVEACRQRGHGFIFQACNYDGNVAPIWGLVLTR